MRKAIYVAPEVEKLYLKKSFSMLTTFSMDGNVEGYGENELDDFGLIS